MDKKNRFLLSTYSSENPELFLSFLLEEAIIIVKHLLQKLASSTDFEPSLQLAFGNNIDTSLLKESWTAGEFVFPEIEIINRAEINNANGAFARVTNKIYLAQEFLLANINNLDAVTDVFLEEYGHFVDSRLNVDDAPGDEGAIFAALVQGKQLSKSELQQLKNEDDTAVVIENKQEIKIEQNQATTELVNVANDDYKGNNYAENPVISANGRYIVFESYADNLVVNDTNFVKDIFIRDLIEDTTQRVSINSEGIEGNGNSEHPVISADGRYVAFESDANNLVANNTIFGTDIFVRDLVNNTIQQVNLTNDGSQTGLSLEPSISGDGRYVAFTSYANNLVAEDNNNISDIFVRDLVNSTTQRVSITDGNLESNNYSLNPSISGDGRYVAFESLADNLVAEDNNNTSDIFVRDLINGKTQRVSVNSEGIEGNFYSKNPSISDDGRYLVFESLSNNLVADDNNWSTDIFVRDLIDNTIQRVSVNSEGIEGNGNSENPTISPDGRYVTFLSIASNLVADDSNFAKDVFVRDLVAGTTERVNLSENGSETSGFTDNPSISNGGRYIAFQSFAKDFIADDTDFSIDIFVRDRGDAFSIPNEEDNNPPEDNDPPEDNEPPEDNNPPEDNDPILPNIKITSLEQNSDRNEITINYNAFDTDSEAKIQLFYDNNNQGANGILIADNLIETDGAGNFVWNTEGIPSGDYYVYAKIFDENNSPVLNYSEQSIQITEVEVAEDRSTTELVSIANNGVKGNNNSYDAVISADGRYVVFESNADNLVPDDTNSVTDIFVRDLVKDTIKRISVNSEGIQFDRVSYNPKISTDSRYVIFTSSVPSGDFINDTPIFMFEDFIHDLVEGTTEPFDSEQHNVNFDSRYTAFTSGNSNLVTGDNNGKQDVFVKDSVTGKIQRASIANDGSQPNDDSFNATVSINGRYVVENNFNASVSINGRYVVFESKANNLVTNDLNPDRDIFVRDLVNNTTRIVSVDNNGVSAYGLHHNPRISSNGRYVFFESDADNLVADDNNRSKGIFVRDLVEGTTQQLSVGEHYSITPDGRYITFQSNDNVYVHDRGASFANLGTTEVILPDPDNSTDRPITQRILSHSKSTPDEALSQKPIVGYDGSYVLFELVGGDSNYEGIYLAKQEDDSLDYKSDRIMDSGKNFDLSGNGSLVFASSADNLVTGDTGDFTDIFVKTNGRIKRVSLTNEGFQANSNSNSPRISHNGKVVVFTSYADNLVPDDTNGLQNIFARNLVNNTTQIVNVANDGTQANGDSYNPLVSADGRYVVFSSDADNLVPNDDNEHRDIFVRDLERGTTELVNVMDDASQTNWLRGNYDLSKDGRYVVFSSVVNEVLDNVDFPVNVQYVFVRDLENGTTQKLALTNYDSVPYILFLNSENDPVTLPDSAVPHQNSYNLRISGGGRFVFFESSYDVFVAEDTKKNNIFVHDLKTNTNELISVHNNIYSDPANGDSYDYDISPDGRYVAFHSDASNLVDGDLNRQKDLFLRDRGSLAVDSLQVIKFDIIPSGFVAQFNEEINPSILNLGQKEVTLFSYHGYKQSVPGSFVWNKENLTLTFVKNGGILNIGNYEFDLSGLDDILWNDHIRKFTVEHSNAPIVSISDLIFASGETKDIPITLNRVTEITKLEFVLNYDPDLLDITAVNLHDSLPTSWQISPEIDRDNGIIKVIAEGNDPLTGNNLNIVNLEAVVPDTANYKELQVLDLENIVLNDNVFNAIDDDGIHQVIRAGDATGDGTVSGLDAYHLMMMSVGLGNNLERFSTIDPMISADMNGDGVISAFDAYYAFKR